MTELTAQENMQEKAEMVFGLDIGTRNVVGTVGHMEGDTFRVLAQYSTEHQTRSMIDGQIHDINRVATTISHVKEELEKMLDFKLERVCIAAAGRVLKTVTTHVEYEYPEETIVTGEDLNTLDLLGVDQAQHELQSQTNDYKYYCVGYTVMKYYLNGEPFTSLEGHKAKTIEEVIIVTFLPEDVVDGLYAAVEKAGLLVANLTLEPIAAINIAIPENFRMLNISLVDVGAGTSDICITKDGSIIAYGMIPYAGDELTEVLVQEFLVDFSNAEKIKKDAVTMDRVTYVDIMGIEHTIDAKEVWRIYESTLDKITSAISEKIIELNGGESVAAVFVVGGGGKVHGFCKMLSEKLNIIEERVALRGEEVMNKINFDQPEIQKDPLIVTPVGICLNYFEQRNRFIMVRFNGEMMKLYDNGKLKIVDAALQAGLTTEEIFPQRGKEIHYTVNGVKKMRRGHAGESARVLKNGVEAGLNARLEPNCDITVETSTVGEHASLRIDEIEEFKEEYVHFIVNGQKVTCPKFVEVNGQLEAGHYEIQDGDVIETLAFYTVGQLAAFMDVEVNLDHEIVVNNRPSSMETLIYENFSVEWSVTGYGVKDGEYRPDGISWLDNEEEYDDEELYEDDAYDEEFLGDEDDIIANAPSFTKVESSADEGASEEEISSGDGSFEEEPETIVDEATKADTESAEDGTEPEVVERADNSDDGADEETVSEEPVPELISGLDLTPEDKPNDDTDAKSEKNTDDFAGTKDTDAGVDNATDETNETDEPLSEEDAINNVLEEVEAMLGDSGPSIGIKSDDEKDYIYYARNQRRESRFKRREADIENETKEDGIVIKKEPKGSEDVAPEENDEDENRSRPAPKNTGINFDMGRKTKRSVTEDLSAIRPVTPFSMDLNKTITQTIRIKVNGEALVMTGKREYIFVDIYNYIDFDPEAGNGRRLITKINDEECSFAAVLHEGDSITLHWADRR